MKSGWFFAAFALAFGAAQAHEEKGAAKPAAEAASVAPLAKPKRDPQSYFSDRELVTQDGRKVRFYTDVLKGHTVVMNTIFTNCQDACPLITQQMVQVKNRLGPVFGKDVVFVSISSDPQRDTPQALKKFAVKQQADTPGWTFLTGKKEDIDFILKRLGQWSEHIESHSTQLIVWNFGADRGRKMLPNMPPEMLAAQITLVAGGDSMTPLPMLGPARSN